MKLKLEGDVFFGEEMEYIKSFETTVHNEKIITGIFHRDDDSFVIKKSYAERGNPESSYDIISKREFLVIASYLLER